MTDNRNEKQLYLRQHILEDGYDANDFISYLESIKGSGYIICRGRS
jgi:hypothetical protein